MLKFFGTYLQMYTMCVSVCVSVFTLGVTNLTCLISLNLSQLTLDSVNIN